MQNAVVEVEEGEEYRVRKVADKESSWSRRRQQRRPSAGLEAQRGTGIEQREGMTREREGG
jgi:hypothetical protein